MFEFINEVIAGIILLGIAGVGGYILNVFRTRKKTVQCNQDDIQALKDDIDNLKRVLVILAKKLDKGSKIYHQDKHSDFEDLVKDLLTDEILGDRKSAI